MALNFNSILLFSENPQVLIDFYKQVFEKDPDWSEGSYGGFKIGDGWVTVGPHDGVHGKSINPERFMFNFETTDVDGEFNRIKALDAVIVHEPYNPDEDPKMKIATFADLDGNYFQLMTPMEPR